MPMKQKINSSPVMTTLTDTFGLGRGAAWGVIIVVSLIAVAAIISFVGSAPPSTITITSGPEGSAFRTNAEKYRVILARSHIKLNILPSHGSLENLERLKDPKVHVDVGFVQGGMTTDGAADKLVSLGSIAYQPLFVFYRSTNTVEVLSTLNGQRLAVGPVGSGTRLLALTLLATNGIEATNSTAFLDLDSDEAAKGLLAGTVDAAFMMGDSASSAILRKLLRAPETHLMNFSQADAYSRRIRYLNKLQLPKGSIDLGKNLPSQDVNLIGPTVELIARSHLHPALSDLLLDAAREIHGKASILQRRGEFPAPLEQDFRISDDATRYYKSGKSFLYRQLPFWLAGIVNRVVLLIVPMAVVLIPGLRLIPVILRWRVKLRLFRWYRALIKLEHELAAPISASRVDLLRRLDHIEASVHRSKVPASFADQFYGLRGHIDYVRSRLQAPPAARPAPTP